MQWLSEELAEGWHSGLFVKDFNFSKLGSTDTREKEKWHRLAVFQNSDSCCGSIIIWVCHCLWNAGTVFDTFCSLDAALCF